MLCDAQFCLEGARAADVQLPVGAVTLHLRDKQPLIDVLVAKVRPSSFINVLFIVVVEIDSFVVNEVLRRLVLLCCRSGFVLSVRGSSGLSIAVVYEFDLDFVHGAASIRFLVQTLILRFIVQAASLLKIVIMLAFWLIRPFLILLPLI